MSLLPLSIKGLGASLLLTQAVPAAAVNEVVKTSMAIAQRAGELEKTSYWFYISMILATALVLSCVWMTLHRAKPRAIPPHRPGRLSLLQLVRRSVLMQFELLTLRWLCEEIGVSVGATPTKEPLATIVAVMSELSPVELKALYVKGGPKAHGFSFEDFFVAA